MGLGNWLAGVGGQAVMARAALPKLTPQQIKDRARKQAAYELACFARDTLMNGPRATPPRWSTIRRMMRVIVAKGPLTQGARILRNGKWVHPTKSRAAWS